MAIMAHPRHTGPQQKSEVVKTPGKCGGAVPEQDGITLRREKGGCPSLAQATAGLVAPSERAGAGGSLGNTAFGDRPTGFLFQGADHNAKGTTYVPKYLGS